MEVPSSDAGADASPAASVVIPIPPSGTSLTTIKSEVLQATPLAVSDAVRAMLGESDVLKARVVQKVNHSWGKSRRVLCLTPYLVFLTDMRGHVHQAIPLSCLAKVMMSTGDVRKLLFKSVPEIPDMLVELIRDDKNAEEDEGWLAAFGQVMRLRGEWDADDDFEEAEPADLAAAAQLRKTKEFSVMYTLDQIAGLERVLLARNPNVRVKAPPPACASSDATAAAVPDGDRQLPADAGDVGRPVSSHPDAPWLLDSGGAVAGTEATAETPATAGLEVLFGGSPVPRSGTMPPLRPPLSAATSVKASSLCSDEHAASQGLVVPPQQVHYVACRKPPSTTTPSELTVPLDVLTMPPRVLDAPMHSSVVPASAPRDRPVERAPSSLGRPGVPSPPASPPRVPHMPWFEPLHDQEAWGLMVEACVDTTSEHVAFPSTSDFFHNVATQAQLVRGAADPPHFEVFWEDETSLVNQLFLRRFVAGWQLMFPRTVVAANLAGSEAFAASREFWQHFLAEKTGLMLGQEFVNARDQMTVQCDNHPPHVLSSVVWERICDEWETNMRCSPADKRRVHEMRLQQQQQQQTPPYLLPESSFAPERRFSVPGAATDEGAFPQFHEFPERSSVAPSVHAPSMLAVQSVPAASMHASAAWVPAVTQSCHAQTEPASPVVHVARTVSTQTRSTGEPTCERCQLQDAALREAALQPQLKPQQPQPQPQPQPPKAPERPPQQTQQARQLVVPMIPQIPAADGPLVPLAHETAALSLPQMPAPLPPAAGAAALTSPSFRSPPPTSQRPGSMLSRLGIPARPSFDSPGTRAPSSQATSKRQHTFWTTFMHEWEKVKTSPNALLSSRRSSAAFNTFPDMPAPLQQEPPPQQRYDPTCGVLVGL